MDVQETINNELKEYETDCNGVNEIIKSGSNISSDKAVGKEPDAEVSGAKITESESVDGELKILKSDNNEVSKDSSEDKNLDANNCGSLNCSEEALRDPASEQLEVDNRGSEKKDLTESEAVDSEVKEVVPEEIDESVHSSDKKHTEDLNSIKSETDRNDSVDDVNKFPESEEEFLGFDWKVDESQEHDFIKYLSQQEEVELQDMENTVNTIELRPSPPPKRKKREPEESDLSSQCSSPALSVSSQLSTLSFTKRSRTGSPASRGSRKSNVDLSNPKYLVPFEHGWRREVVTRGITTKEDGITKDVYYFHPSGKKLRSLREVSEKLTPGVTIENFTFYKEPLGADPQFETVRNARVHGQSPSDISTPKTPAYKSRIERAGKETPPIAEAPKPSTPARNIVKTPKEEIKPPPAKREKLVLKFNKGTPKIALKKPPAAAAAAAATAVNGEQKSPKLPAVSKLEGPKPHPSAPLGPRRKITPRKKFLKPQNNNKEDKQIGRPDGGDLEMGMLPPLWSPTAASNKSSSNESLSWSHLDEEKSTNEEGRLDNCSIRCTKAMGLIPTLQCSVCLCLYHPECCDMGPISSYLPILPFVCKKCQVKATETKPRGLVKHITPVVPTCDKNTPIISPKPIHATLSPSPTGQPPPVPIRAPPINRPKMPASKGVVGGVTTWLPPSNSVFRSPSTPKSSQPKPDEPSLPPQTIVNMNNKRFIVIPKHNVLSVNPNQNQPAQSSGPCQTSTVIMPTLTSTIIHGPPLYNNPLIQPSNNSSGVTLAPCLQGDNVSVEPSQYLVVNPIPGSSATPSAHQPDLPTGSETPAHFSKVVDKALKRPSIDGVDESMQKFMRNICIGYSALLNVFQYLKVQELLRAGRVCRLWRDLASHPSLWRTVRMKNSQVSDWKGFTDSLSRHGTKHLDLRKMLVSLDETEEMWTTFANHISGVKCLERLDMCRCSVKVIEQITEACPHLLVFNAQMIGVKDQSVQQRIPLETLSNMKNLKELRMKSFFGLYLTGSLKSLTSLASTLTTLSLTSVKDLGMVQIEHIGKLQTLEALELGECSDLPENFPATVIAKLTKLKRIRLEKGPSKCSTNEMLHEMSRLQDLTQLELINFDIRPGFDEALSTCINIKRLLLIPTYVTQSATTNNIILSGAFKLWKTLTHFVWVVTMELLKVTELFVDQCEGKGSKKSGGNSVPVLKPVPIPEVGTNQEHLMKRDENAVGSKNPTPITVIPIDELFQMLTEALPRTRVKLLKIPFQNTWRQSITENNSSSL